MKPPAFAYARPTALDEALVLLAEGDGGAVAIAGGQSLVPALSFRLAYPDVIVDLNQLVELQGVEATQNHLRVAALTKHAELVASEAVRARLPALALAAAHIGHAPIRNRGTLGGSVAHADPAAELPAVLVAAGAEIELHSSAGARTAPADDFFLGPYTTAKSTNELITAVRFSCDQPAGWGCAEVSRRSGDFALAGAVVGTTAEDGVAHDVRVAFFGLEPRPRRVEAVERALSGTSVDNLLDRVADVELVLDMHADDEAEVAYRQRIARAVLRRALEQAVSGQGVSK